MGKIVILDSKWCLNVKFQPYVLLLYAEWKVKLYRLAVILSFTFKYILFIWQASWCICFKFNPSQTHDTFIDTYYDAVFYFFFILF